MTEKPDDVAMYVTMEPGVSRRVADLLRGGINRDIIRDSLHERGFTITDEDAEAARAEISDAQAKITPALRVQAAALRDEVERIRARYRR